MSLNNPTLGDAVIQYADETKFLGIILDRRLTWNQHTEYIKNKTMGE